MRPEPLPRLKAPPDDGAVLAHPPLTEAGALLAANVQLLNDASLQLQGRSLSELRSLARRETLAAARQYLHEAGEPVPEPTGDHILLAGHQPELFHPGVWFKNFALHGLARHHGATALNLVVDNDTGKSSALRVPHDAHVAKVPFDTQSDAPYEERPVQDEALFASLPERVAPLTRDWPFKPLLEDFWAEVLRQRARTPLLGERFAAARRTCERKWGSQTLEVPLSRVCRTETFAWFAVHVLGELPRFHADYNNAVREYRRRHELRSRLHPVPDLALEGAWLETPFWAWRTAAPRRQRLWARPIPDGIEMRAGTAAWPALRGDVATRIAQWRRLEKDGYKVRTRALTTTLYSRLMIGDLFMHGIGGGKYDEVSDNLLRRFFGLEPPRYLVLTATLLLPLDRFPTALEERRNLDRLRRDILWNPQRHLDGAAAAAELVAEKQRWMARDGATHEERGRRFTHLREVNERLRPFVARKEEQVRRAVMEAEARRRLHAIHAARDYTFCLYPEESLRGFYQRFL